MAQSQTHVRPVGEPDSVDPNAAQAAWIAACSARKFNVRNGKVYAYANGKLVEVYAPAGWNADLPAWIAQAALQFATYRVVQTGEGNVQEAVNKLMNGTSAPTPNSSHAHDAAFRDAIVDMIEERLGALPDKATVEARAERAKIIEQTMFKYDPATPASATTVPLDKRQEFYDAQVGKALEYAHNVPTTEKKKRGRTGAAADTSAALDL